MIELHPPKVLEGHRKIMVFQNKNGYDIHIEHMRFKSDIHPREWDTHVRSQTLPRWYKTHRIHPPPELAVPIVGTGTIFMRWYGNSKHEPQADTFQVLFDSNNQPYPYVFGGDRWTMALRHAALRAMKENGE